MKDYLCFKEEIFGQWRIDDHNNIEKSEVCLKIPAMGFKGLLVNMECLCPEKLARYFLNGLHLVAYTVPYDANDCGYRLYLEGAVTDGNAFTRNIIDATSWGPATYKNLKCTDEDPLNKIHHLGTIKTEDVKRLVKLLKKRVQYSGDLMIRTQHLNYDISVDREHLFNGTFTEGSFVEIPRVMIPSDKISDGYITMHAKDVTRVCKFINEHDEVNFGIKDNEGVIEVRGNLESGAINKTIATFKVEGEIESEEPLPFRLINAKAFKKYAKFVSSFGKYAKIEFRFSDNSIFIDVNNSIYDNNNERNTYTRVMAPIEE